MSARAAVVAPDAHSLLYTARVSDYLRVLLAEATNYHLGLLKAKLAKLRRELIEPSGGGGGGKGGEGFDVAKVSLEEACRD